MNSWIWQHNGFQKANISKALQWKCFLHNYWSFKDWRCSTFFYQTIMLNSSQTQKHKYSSRRMEKSHNLSHSPILCQIKLDFWDSEGITAIDYLSKDKELLWNCRNLLRIPTEMSNRRDVENNLCRPLTNNHLFFQ